MGQVLKRFRVVRDKNTSHLLIYVLRDTLSRTCVLAHLNRTDSLAMTITSMRVRRVMIPIPLPRGARISVPISGMGVDLLYNMQRSLNLTITLFLNPIPKP